MSRLRQLSTLLRDEAKWPEAFGPWDYSSTQTCALALAFHADIVPHERIRCSPVILAETPGYRPQPSDINHRNFAMSYNDWLGIFHNNGAARLDRERWRRVTPGEIADRIDAYLGQRRTP